MSILQILNFQIILDLLDCKDNFPGVGEEFLIDIWSKICPETTG